MKTNAAIILPLNFSGTRPDGTTTIKKTGHVIHGNFFSQSAFAAHALADERNLVVIG